MDIEIYEHETGAAPRASIIVLHGLGADGHDFEALAEELDLSAVGPVRFLFPNAPMRPVTINGGYVMRAWYDILGSDLQRREDEAGLRASQGLVAALLDRERERGVAPQRTVLAGFSQGAAMTLLTGLRYPQRLAGLVALSGYLPLAGEHAAEASDANRATPVFMGHGRSDPIVPIDRGEASRDALLAAGHAVEWHDYPMPHSVCPQEVADLQRFLQRVLAEPARAA